MFAFAFAAALVTVSLGGPAQKTTVAIGSGSIDTEFDQELGTRIQASILQGLRRGSVELLDPAEGCERADAACHREAAVQSGAQFLVETQIRWTDPDVTIVIEIVDRRGESVASRKGTCELCGQAELLEWAEGEAASLVPRIARLGPLPARLVIDGSPAGASVTINGRTVGRLPYEGEWPAGEYEVEVAAKGHLEQRKPLTLDSGTDESLRIDLAPAPVESEGGQKRRPIIGWSLLGVGIAGAAAGATLWAIDGREHASTCSDANRDPFGACPNVYTTRAAGIGTLAAGVAVGIGGALVLGLSRKAGKTRVEARVGPRSFTLTGRF